MALIAMAVYSTEENGKDECLGKTLLSLSNTVDFHKHRLMLSVNASTKRTEDILNHFDGIVYKTIRNGQNIGTANAINKAWQYVKPYEHVVKMDDDILIHTPGWLDEMEEAVKRDPNLGQIGLKRKDCWENVNHPDPDYKSELIQLPHQPGERWLTVEKANHIIGSCVLHTAEWINKCGALYQPTLYGYDDVIASWRTKAAGMYSCFLPHVNIDHIDDGQTPYQSWKEKHAGEVTDEVIKLCHAIYRGEKSFYYPFN